MPDAHDRPRLSTSVDADLRWRVPSGQRLVFADFDDGVVMFDFGEGATHLLNATAAETLTIVQEVPGLSTAQLHARVLERLGIGPDILPVAALEQLLHHSEDLNLVSVCSA